MVKRTQAGCSVCHRRRLPTYIYSISIGDAIFIILQIIFIISALSRVFQLRKKN